jgi:hypothetical protein
MSDSRQVLASLFALVLGFVSAVQAAVIWPRVGAIEDAPRCATPFAAGCITERDAIVEGPHPQWRPTTLGAQEWELWVPDGTPGPEGPEPFVVDVPGQHGQEKLRTGVEATVVFYGRSAAWIRLDGVVLETTHHPRQEAARLTWLALFFGPMGVFIIREMARSGDRIEWPSASAREVPRPDAVLGVLGFAGCLGFAGHFFSDGGLGPGVAGGLLGAMLGLLAWRRARRRQAAHN